DIAASTANQNEKRTSIDTLKGKAKELEASDKTISGKITGIGKTLTKIQTDITTQRRTIRGINSSIQSEIERVTRDQTRLESLQENIGEIEEKAALFDEMDIPPPPEEFSIEQSLKMTTDLQIQMDQLQPVNRKAIKQYDLESQKNKKLTSQRSKIMAERNSIQEFMEEIEREKTNIFMEVYRAINANFSRIFSYISPGGSGELSLETPDAPFLGGIDIRAKPRGKAVRNTRVMSGGEKSLTALALIFAIQDYRPAPFYILDEVDASLDDVNSDRVAALIHSLAKNNQFIIVSLRDVTIAKAERLIGVVSQLGRSRILSVELTAGGELEFATTE
ncbi:MAG: hypothetical protein ACXACA_07255, partial [Candidatus Ranarchaeia archaeon]